MAIHVRDGLRELCAHIDANLEEPLSLSVLARQFHMSPFSFLQKTFKACARHLAQRICGCVPRVFLKK